MSGAAAIMVMVAAQGSQAVNDDWDERERTGGSVGTSHTYTSREDEGQAVNFGGFVFVVVGIMALPAVLIMLSWLAGGPTT